MTSSGPVTDEPRAALVRVEPVDVLALDGGVLLLFERTVVRLSDLGRTIVELCAQPRTEAEIARYLATTFGTPPDQTLEDATSQAIQALLADGVLRRDNIGTNHC